MPKFKILMSLLGLLLFIIFKPNTALAARIYLSNDNSQISVGDTAIVNLMLDTEGQTANVVDGNISINQGFDNIIIRELSPAGSILNFWAKNPSLENNSISFVGGTPGGFNNSSALLFKIVFSAKRAGQVVFSPADFKVYANDGKATPLNLKSETLALNIDAQKKPQPSDQWQELVSKDNQPPEISSAIISSDPTVYDGKKFLAITTTDNQSGIDHLEVKEGNWPIVRTGNIYVLRDQDKISPILVIAYDRAGNMNTMLVNTARPTNKYYFYLLVLSALVFLPLIIFFLIKTLKTFKTKKK